MELTTDYPPQDWETACSIPKIESQEGYGSGVAALAMVLGKDYATGRALFVKTGMAQRRGSKHPLSTNLSDMITLLTIAGLACSPRKWTGWNQFRGLGIVKVRPPALTRGWYWAVAFTHPQYDIVLFDPHCDLPGLRRLPMDVMVVQPERYLVVGKWIQVENLHHGSRDA